MRNSILINVILCITVLSIIGLIYVKEYVSKVLVKRYTKQKDDGEIESQSGKIIYAL